MVSNNAGDTVLSMEKDADPFFMRGSASKSLHVEELLALVEGSAVEGLSLLSHQFAREVA
jgi:hypothetical protein